MTISIPFWLIGIFLAIPYMFLGAKIYERQSTIASGPRGLIFNPGQPLSPFFWLIGWLILLPMVYLRQFVRMFHSPN